MLFFNYWHSINYTCTRFNERTHGTSVDQNWSVLCISYCLYTPLPTVSGMQRKDKTLLVGYNVQYAFAVAVHSPVDPCIDLV